MFNKITGEIKDALSRPIVGILASGVGGIALGSAVGYAAAKRRSKKRRTRKAKTRKKRSYYKKNTRRTRRTPRTAGKRRDRSSKRIRYTKNGQPYIINKRTGKAKFIKRSSAKRSHKKQGGRY